MENIITIRSEKQYKSSWLHIFLPKKLAASSLATIRTMEGEVIKIVTLKEGNNAIDISGIHETSINIKVETPYETILKQLKINEQ
jgi:hypothetical protein